MIAVVALSALVGAVRGLTFELLSLAGWVVAWFAGLWLGPLLAPHLPVGAVGSPLNVVASFACAFIVVLIVWGLMARVGRRLRSSARCSARPIVCSARRSGCCAAWRAPARRRRGAGVHAGRDDVGVARIGRRGAG